MLLCIIHICCYYILNLVASQSIFTISVYVFPFVLHFNFHVHCKCFILDVMNNGQYIFAGFIFYLKITNLGVFFFKKHIMLVPCMQACRYKYLFLYRMMYRYIDTISYVTCTHFCRILLQRPGLLGTLVSYSLQTKI